MVLREVTPEGWDSLPFRLKRLPSVGLQACNASPWEAETEDQGFKATLSYLAILRLAHPVTMAIL